MMITLNQKRKEWSSKNRKLKIRQILLKLTTNISNLPSPSLSLFFYNRNKIDKNQMYYSLKN